MLVGKHQVKGVSLDATRRPFFTPIPYAPPPRCPAPQIDFATDDGLPHENASLPPRTVALVDDAAVKVELPPAAAYPSAPTTTATARPQVLVLPALPLAKARLDIDRLKQEKGPRKSSKKSRRADGKKQPPTDYNLWAKDNAERIKEENDWVWVSALLKKEEQAWGCAWSGLCGWCLPTCPLHLQELPPKKRTNELNKLVGEAWQAEAGEVRLVYQAMAVQEKVSVGTLTCGVRAAAD
jgi:hypothetical protein